MSTYLTDLIARSCSIGKEAFATLTNPLNGAAYNVDAFDRYFAVSESFPYLTHRVTGLPIDHADNNENEQFPQPRLWIRVVVAHLTTGYAGEPDNRIYTYIPTLTSYYANRNHFQSAAYPTRPDYLDRSEVVDAGGFMVFDNRGFAGISQVGFELQIACIFTEFVQQVYL